MDGNLEGTGSGTARGGTVDTALVKFLGGTLGETLWEALGASLGAALWSALGATLGEDLVALKRGIKMFFLDKFT